MPRLPVHAEIALDHHVWYDVYAASAQDCTSNLLCYCPAAVADELWFQPTKSAVCSMCLEFFNIAWHAKPHVHRQHLSDSYMSWKWYNPIYKRQSAMGMECNSVPSGCKQSSTILYSCYNRTVRQVCHVAICITCHVLFWCEV